MKNTQQYDYTSVYEGVRNLIYDDANGNTLTKGDSLKGFATIGVGHNISANGLRVNSTQADGSLYDGNTQTIIKKGVEIANFPCIKVNGARNLATDGITNSEIEFVFDNDVDMVINQLTKSYAWFENLDSARQVAIVDLVFNMGINAFSQFHMMINCLAKGDYSGASQQLVNSTYYTQANKNTAGGVRIGRGDANRLTLLNGVITCQKQ